MTAPSASRRRTASRRSTSATAQLVEDERVDAVYVATPHSEHREHALLAIAAGKHVLVEKAFTRNAAEAEEIFAAAREAGVFVMEAMWTRFLPHVDALHQVVDAGEIGEIINVSADHGQYFAFDPKSRLFDPNLAGGALLDLGVYPVSFAHDFLGVPDSIQAVGQLTETGVDGQISIAMTYGERTQATLMTTLWAKSPTTAEISGTEGRISVAGDFYGTTSFRVQRLDGRVWTFDKPGQKGLQFEAAEVARRVARRRRREPAHDVGEHARGHADDGRHPRAGRGRLPGRVTPAGAPPCPRRRLP